MTEPMIRFGPMSIVLLCGALYGVLRAVILCCIPVNRCANRLLGALILVLVLYTAPYIIGYAGYYDAYPWLSFAPYNLTLAIGPLLYLHVASLLDGGERMPPRWWLHFLPAMAQAVYYTTVFLQPLAFKNNWDDHIHQPYVDPPETALLLLSLGVYWRLARRRQSRHDGMRQEWLRNFMIASGLTVAFWFLLVFSELLSGGLSYFQRFPFYLWLAILPGWLGKEGERAGAVSSMPDVSARRSKPHAVPVEASVSAPSQAELGERWRARITEEQWWRDPELTLAATARHLGTNATALSRALNEGLGTNFNEAVNRIRVEAVVRALEHVDEDRSVLDIALQQGFNSKASFNRAFKLYMGETPTEYRKRTQPGPAHAPVSSSG